MINIQAKIAMCHVHINIIKHDAQDSHPAPYVNHVIAAAKSSYSMIYGWNKWKPSIKHSPNGLVCIMAHLCTEDPSHPDIAEIASIYHIVIHLHVKYGIGENRGNM